MRNKEQLPALRGAPRLRGPLGWIGDVANQLPGAQIVRQMVDAAEERLLAELQLRLNELPLERQNAAPVNVHPGQRLAELLQQQSGQNSEAARRALFDRLVASLLPDEARLLATLSDGDAFALMHVAVGRTAANRRIVAKNFSSLASASSVRLRDKVPVYIANLRHWSLAVEGPEQRSLDLKYQVLEGSREVQDCCKALKQQGESPRLQRRVLRLSEFGAAFWAYCQPGSH